MSPPQSRITLVLASSQAHDRYGSGGTPGGFLESILYNERARETLVAYFFIAFIASNLGILIQWPQVSRTPNLQTDAPLLSRSCVCVCVVYAWSRRTSGLATVTESTISCVCTLYFQRFRHIQTLHIFLCLLVFDEASGMSKVGRCKMFHFCTLNSPFSFYT